MRRRGAASRAPAAPAVPSAPTTPARQAVAVSGRRALSSRTFCTYLVLCLSVVHAVVNLMPLHGSRLGLCRACASQWGHHRGVLRAGSPMHQKARVQADRRMRGRGAHAAASLSTASGKLRLASARSFSTSTLQTLAHIRRLRNMVPPFPQEQQPESGFNRAVGAVSCSPLRCAGDMLHQLLSQSD